MKNYKSLIANHAQAANSFLDVTDKWSGEVIARVGYADEAMIELALTKAQACEKRLSHVSHGRREAWLRELYKKLEVRAPEFTSLISKEAGKPISYAKAEIDRCLVTLKIAAEEARRLVGEKVSIDFGAGAGKSAFTDRFPVGTILGISPFNFPLNLALHKLAPAIASGCPIILKPSPLAPASLFAFAELFEGLDMPEGAVSILMCTDEQAAKLSTDPRIKLISFTGSPKVGWSIKEKAGKKKVLLELGGNAPVIVDESAELSDAAKKVAVGAFLYAGQICISTQRVFVHQKIFADFQKRVLDETAKLIAADPANEKSQIGPMISKQHLERVSAWVDEAIAAKATVLCGAKVLDEKHNLYAPTWLTNVPKNQKVSCQEVFGPVAILESVSDFDEAIVKANDTSFGLQAGVFTNRLDHMKQAYRDLEYAGVMINNIPGFRVDSMPYGGIKDSGFGREGLRYAIEEFTESKLLVF
tara:strand:- start:6395 stop:7813 length:1419 start_codon:yes stop_codon:yes gene_type:complete